MNSNHHGSKYEHYPEHYACEMLRKIWLDDCSNDALAYGHYARDAEAEPEAAGAQKYERE